MANGSVSREEMDMCFARTREKMNEGKIKINLQSTSLMIPPTPVAAPPYGSTALGWLQASGTMETVWASPR